MPRFCTTLALGSEACACVFLRSISVASAPAAAGGSAQDLLVEAVGPRVPLSIFPAAGQGDDGQVHRPLARLRLRDVRVPGHGHPSHRGDEWQGVRMRGSACLCALVLHTWAWGACVGGWRRQSICPVPASHTQILHHAARAAPPRNARISAARGPMPVSFSSCMCSCPHRP
jgi:hypothetical protein